MADVHSKEVRSFNMSRIRSKGTKIEIMLAKVLWNRNIRYRKNDKTVFGKPDFVFKGIKLAVFCDSEFWHGKDYDTLCDRIGTNKDFWIQKIERNINRDLLVNQTLKNQNWTVLRFWEKQIKKDISFVADSIENEIKRLKQIPYNSLKTLL